MDKFLGHVNRELDSLGITNAILIEFYFNTTEKDMPFEVLLLPTPTFESILVQLIKLYEVQTSPMEVIGLLFKYNTRSMNFHREELASIVKEIEGEYRQAEMQKQKAKKKGASRLYKELLTEVQ